MAKDMEPKFKKCIKKGKKPMVCADQCRLKYAKSGKERKQCGILAKIARQDKKIKKATNKINKARKSSKNINKSLRSSFKKCASKYSKNLEKCRIKCVKKAKSKNLSKKQCKLLKKEFVGSRKAGNLAKRQSKREARFKKNKDRKNKNLDRKIKNARNDNAKRRLKKRKKNMNKNFSKKNFKKVCRGGIPDRDGVLKDLKSRNKCCKQLHAELAPVVAGISVAAAVATGLSFGTASIAVAGGSMAIASVAIAGGTSAVGVGSGIGAAGVAASATLGTGIKRMNGLKCKQTGKLLRSLKRKAKLKKKLNKLR